MKDQYDNRKQELLNSILKGRMKEEQGNHLDTIHRTFHKKAPLSYAQSRMWFLHQLNQEDDSYNMHSVLKLTGELDKKALTYSLLKIVERHEILRTNFKVNEIGEPIQVVMEEVNQNIDMVDMTGCNEKEIFQFIADEIKKPFNLEQDLLIRANLLKQSEDCHYLIVIMHHIVSDGWSFGILSRELMLYYNRYLDKDYTIEPLDIQYIDYTYWQQQYLSSGRMERQFKYWKQQLTNLPEPLDLKVKKPNVAVITSTAEKQVSFLERNRLEGIKELCKRNGVTLYMTMLAAYVILLNRYSFQEDFIIGTPVANRRKKELENLIGFFVNTLPIRIKLNQKEMFHEFLQEVKKVAVDSFSNQDIPFEYLVKEMIGERYNEQVPIIQTMFVLQNTQQVKMSLPKISIESEIMDNSIAKFDLLLTVIEMENGLRLSFEYKKDMFPSGLMEAIAEKYIKILDDIIENDHKQIGDLANQEEVIKNKDPLFDLVNPFQSQHIIDRFYEIVKRNNNKVAVNWNNEMVSYFELNNRSNQLSRYIDRFNLEKESFIGLCMERSIDMIVSILAILKSNCAYVPLDPDSPQDRLNFIVEDANLRLLIGHREKLEKINISDDIHILDVREKQFEILEESEADKIINRQPLSSAYMIYTSGSTGNPKGVIVSDNNVLRLFSHTDNLYHFSNEDVWTMFHSVAFDFSVWEIWGALLYGGQLVVVPYKTSRDPEAFMQLLMDKKVTVLNQTPSAFRQLLQCEGIYDKNTVDKMHLKYVIFGGEALDFGMLKQWMDVYGDMKPLLVNMYGITETTVHVTYEVLNKQKINNTNQSLIGMPIKDLQIYILDDHMRIVPDGVVGEMYVGGAGVSKGYWNRKALNEERFIQNPFLSEQDTLYKTGDLACRHINGDLEYVGRNDNQVKIKGFRMELNEIKEQISKNPLVKDNVVVLDRIEDDGRIISYLKMDNQEKSKIISELLEKDDYDIETEEVFDHNYRQKNNLEDDLFNIVGWNNSYNNEQISEKEMREWLDSICYKLYELPMHTVLEIGVGTGMILHQIASRVDCYVGLDISKEAIEYNKRIIEKHQLNYDNVKLLHSSVENLEDKIQMSFDTIIINSVAQYFPDVTYFENALKASIERIHEKGNIIIGDVRSYDRLNMYYLSVELSHLDQKASISTLKKNIETRRENEKELIFSCNYFKELDKRFPEIACVTITPKHGYINNELSKYRYDVILTIKKQEIMEPSDNLNVEILDWKQSNKEVSLLKNNIENYNGDILHIVNIPDERVEFEARFIQQLESISEQTTIESFSKLLQYQKCNSLSYGEIKDITSASKEKGFYVHISVDNVLGCLDMILFKPYIKKESVVQYLNNYYSYDNYEEKTTDPLKYKVQYKAVEKIKEFLKDKLPYYMIPNEFILIDRLPLTINGKIDYEALPKPKLCNITLQKENWCEENIIKEVTRVWRNLLHVEEVLPDDNFFLLGGHSLLATNLIFSLNDIYGIRIPLKYLFEEPTVRGISKYIQDKLNLNETVLDKQLNLEQDVHLPDNFKVPKLDVTNDDKVLVTGATGFFGAFLVKRLLEDTLATVYCLVRASNQEHAQKRLMDTLHKYKLYEECYMERIVVICGDLSKSNLGMDAKEYDTYAREIDVIVHNGAKVNFFEPYEGLKDTNVGGTLEILKLATAHKTKPIHFISSLYVYEPAEDNATEYFIKEEQPLAGYRKLRMGYTQSKWVAEKILELAKAEGLPVNIYRLGRISGHSKTGACQQNDFLWTLVKGCIEIGCYPDQELTFEFTPVDYLTEAVVKIMESGELNKNYHLFNYQKTSLKDIVQAMSKSYNLKAVNKDQWISSITSVENSSRHLSQLLTDDTFEGGYLNFNNDNVVKHVPYYCEGVKVSKGMLEALNDYFIEVGYFPPGKSAEEVLIYV